MYVSPAVVMSNLRVGGMPSSDLGTIHNKAQLGHWDKNRTIKYARDNCGMNTICIGRYQDISIGPIHNKLPKFVKKNYFFYNKISCFLEKNSEISNQ